MTKIKTLKELKKEKHNTEYIGGYESCKKAIIKEIEVMICKDMFYDTCCITGFNSLKQKLTGEEK